MEVKYRIIKIDPEEHSIIVRYFTDKITEVMLAMELDGEGNAVLDENGFPTMCRTDYNINIFQVPSPSQEDVIRIINQNAPIDWLVLQENIKDPNIDTSLSSISDLVNVEGTVVKPTAILPPV